MKLRTIDTVYNTNIAQLREPGSCIGTLQRIHRQYIRYESALDDTLIGIENLNSGYLTHRILDPQILGKYLEAVEDDLEETAPEFEPVFTSVY